MLPDSIFGKIIGKIEWVVGLRVAKGFVEEFGARMVGLRAAGCGYLPPYLLHGSPQN